MSDVSSRFPVPDLASLPDDMRARIDSVSEKSGFVPNVFRVLAHRPDEFRAFFAYHDALMEKERLADQLATDYSRADISERQIAMLDFACLVADQAADVTEDDLEELKEHGFSDEDIWDIGAIAAFFALSNRMAGLTNMLAGLTNMLPNDEFYSLGRDPKASKPRLVK